MIEVKNIAFIIPAYNCEATLSQTVESIFDGNFTDGDEVIIVNDGSADNTALVIRSLLKRFPVIKYKEHLSNLGGATARNTAVNMAQAPWIFCLDSDNRLLPDSVPKLLQFAIREKLDAAAFEEVIYCNASNLVTHKWVYKSGRVDLADALAGPISPCSSGNYLYTKISWERAGGYRESSGALDAWTFGVAQLATGSIMGVLSGIGYLHRYGHASYWVRERKKLSPSKIASKTLLEYSALFSPKSLDVLKNSNEWMDKLESKPLSLQNKKLGITGRVIFNIFRLGGLKKALAFIIRNPKKFRADIFFYSQ